LTQDARTLGNLSVQLAAQGRWREALEAAHACLDLAEPGSVLYLWALHMLACTYVDAGMPHRARPYALAYLSQAAGNPQLEPYTPYVVRAMGHIAFQERRFLSAFRWFSHAHALFSAKGDFAQAAVSSQAMALALVRAGRPRQARAALEDRSLFPADRAYLFDSAMAAILAAECRYEDALVFGRAALQAIGRRQSLDLVDAAEVALVLADALRHLNQVDEASAMLYHAAAFAALQGWKLESLLRLNERAGGGDPLEPAAPSRGSANLRHRGCFTTGIA